MFAGTAAFLSEQTGIHDCRLTTSTLPPAAGRKGYRRPFFRLAKLPFHPQSINSPSLNRKHNRCQRGFQLRRKRRLRPRWVTAKRGLGSCSDRKCAQAKVALVNSREDGGEPPGSAGHPRRVFVLTSTKAGRGLGYSTTPPGSLGPDARSSVTRTMVTEREHSPGKAVNVRDFACLLPITRHEISNLRFPTPPCRAGPGGGHEEYRFMGSAGDPSPTASLVLHQVSIPV